MRTYRTKDVVMEGVDQQLCVPYHAGDFCVFLVTTTVTLLFLGESSHQKL